MKIVSRILTLLYDMPYFSSFFLFLKKDMICSLSIAWEREEREKRKEKNDTRRKKKTQEFTERERERERRIE